MGDGASLRGSGAASPTVKKQSIEHVEMGVDGDDIVKLSQDEAELEEALRNYVPGTSEEKKLVWKVDLLLMPILWVMYILNYVDRTNIGNAKVAGMADDLNLDDQRYAWIVSIFFFGYLICEVPSNMILARSRPSIFLPGIMIVWGGLSAAMGSAKSYGAMLAFRFVVGCVESGFFPGVLYLLSCWYTSAELGKRFTIFYTASTLSGAFGGLIAGAITDGLHNAHGISGWRWLFIVEGVCTVGVAVIAISILLDYPSTSKRLSLRERQLATIRLIADQRANNPSSQQSATVREPLSHWDAFVAALADYRTGYFLIMLMLNVGAGTISYFIPTLTETLGYSGATAQYMTVPIYIVAAFIANCTAVVADMVQRRRRAAGTSDGVGGRRRFVGSFLALGCVSSIICAIVTQKVVRYVFTCFVAAGIWTALPLALAWISATFSVPSSPNGGPPSPEKRAIVLALVNACGNLSSVYGSRIWPDKDTPEYTMGWSVTAAFLGLATLMVIASPVAFRLPVKEVVRRRNPDDVEGQAE